VWYCSWSSNRPLRTSCTLDRTCLQGFFGAVIARIDGGCSSTRSPKDVVHAPRGPSSFQHVRTRIPERCFTCRWTGRGGPLFWHARSPDLNALDIFVWGHLRCLVYETPLEREDDLPRIQAACDNILQTLGIFERMRKSMARRCGLCNEVGGRHF
jgi:hypothetical protein